MTELIGPKIRRHPENDARQLVETAMSITVPSFLWLQYYHPGWIIARLVEEIMLAASEKCYIVYSV